MKKYLALFLYTHLLIGMNTPQVFIEDPSVFTPKKITFITKEFACNNELFYKARILDCLLAQHGYYQATRMPLYLNQLRKWRELSTQLFIEAMSELHFTFNKELAWEKINQWLRTTRADVILQNNGLVGFIVEKIKEDYAENALNNLKK